VSYDVSIGDFDGNYTFNVSALFYDHIPAERSRGGLHELDGLTGKQAGEVLHQMWRRIHNTKMNFWHTRAVGEPEFCAKYDAPNGWGSAVGALIFLGELTAACAVYPRHKVRVSA